MASDRSAGEEPLQGSSPDSQETRPLLFGDVDPVETRPMISGTILSGNDHVRRVLAFRLTWILAGTILGGMFLLAFSPLLKLGAEDVRAIVEIFFPSMVTLVGTVLGFYFGSERQSQEPPKSGASDS